MSDHSDSEMLEEIIVDTNRRNPQKRPATPPPRNTPSPDITRGSIDSLPTLTPMSSSPEPYTWRPTLLEALKGKSSREHILLARDILLQASITEENQEEKLRILDLVEIFRDYTEKKRLKSATKILASQISDLEKVAKNLRNTPKPAQPQSQIPPAPPATPKPRTFAQVVGNTTPASTSTWQLVGKKGKTTTTTTTPPATSPREKHREKRLVLVQTVKTNEIDPLQLRNALNDAFKN